MNDRKLTESEERLAQELGLDRDKFRGAMLANDNRVVRRDPYFVVERREISSYQTVRSQLQGLEMGQNLRFGNYMQSLSNLLVLAKTLKLNQVFLAENTLLVQEFTVQGIRFSQAQPTQENTLKGAFFYRKTFADHFRFSPTPFQVFHLFRPALRQLNGSNPFETVTKRLKLFTKSISNSLGGEMTIHIRSGDVFLLDEPHPLYWQPPLSFYTDVIRKESPRRIGLVIEDQANPVIPALIRWVQSNGIPLTLHDGELAEAIFQLITARYIVGGRGSFLGPIVAMNTNVRTLECFGDDSHSSLPKIVSGRVRFASHPVGDYVESVSPWANTPIQRQAMLEWQPRRGLDLSEVISPPQV